MRTEFNDLRSSVFSFLFYSKFQGISKQLLSIDPQIRICVIFISNSVIFGSDFVWIYRDRLINIREKEIVFVDNLRDYSNFDSNKRKGTSVRSNKGNEPIKSSKWRACRDERDRRGKRVAAYDSRQT